MPSWGLCWEKVNKNYCRHHPAYLRRGQRPVSTNAKTKDKPKKSPSETNSYVGWITACQHSLSLIYTNVKQAVLCWER